MHTIKPQNKDEFYVGYMTLQNDGHGNSWDEFIPMFHGMSVTSAIRLCNMLNGGEVKIDDLYAKVLPSLVVRK